MKPYGREKNLKGGKPWKIDVHPKKGFVNWWEDMVDYLTRSRMKQKWKKDIDSDMFYCEIETNPAHQKCKDQCNWCKLESDKMKQ